jgi:endonuclease/exonuclease/phosphatase family metal-dependent hydrolase
MFERPLTLVSLNIKGLRGDLHKPKEIKAWLASLPPPPPLIKDHDILMEGCAQFVTLQSPEGGTLSIINVYAQRSSNDRTPLWRRITQAEFTADHVIVGGDFNHLEETGRRGLSNER